MSVRISEVTDADLADLVALRLRWQPAASPDEAGALDVSLRAWWGSERDRRVAWLARHTDGQAVGMANAVVFTRMPSPGRPAARWAYVANVFVVVEHRREGVGSRLMDSVVEWARAEGMMRIVLAPSEMSASFYRHLGFRPAEDLMRLDLVRPWA